MKEMDDLEKKINEKTAIIEDKQDQINYLRGLINDYKEQVKSNSDNLELQLKKITRTYDNLLTQKDSIIDKQDKTIEEMIESAKQLSKDNKATITSLEMQIGTAQRRAAAQLSPQDRNQFVPAPSVGPPCR